MKYILAFAIMLLAGLGAPVYAQSGGSLGLTPCTMAQQPADLSFSGVSANRQLSTCGETVIVFNNSTSDARFRIGSGAGTTALSTDLLLPQKTYIVLNTGVSGMYFAAISSGSGTISFIQGRAAP